MRERRSLVVAPWLLCLTSLAVGAEVEPFRPVAADGTPCPIVLAEQATAAEVTAADELASYLATVTGAPFRVQRERDQLPDRPAIWVGATAVARASGAEPARFAPDEWRLLQRPEGLIVAGGRPRGTLYAAYHFLEDQLGVRWWTPFDEEVPRDPFPSIGPLDTGGRPRFAVRDMNALAGPPAFRARSRLNGHHSELAPGLGDSERYGPPYHVHTFAWYIPADELGDAHPEYFALFDGERRPGSGQLCMSSAPLRVELLRRIEASIERGSAEATAVGRLVPTVYDLSPDDREGYCTCEPCRALVERHGGESGPLIDLVSELASALAVTRPGIRLSTLAYYKTVRPPTGLSELSPNVVVRFSDLQRRDFLRPLSDSRHRELLAWLDRWLELAGEVRVWAYGVTFGSGHGLPFPNLPALADDLRLYAERGVSSVYVQFDFPESSDMRALKRWVIPRLLEDPQRDLARLVREFTDGYYGAAGPAIRRALRIVERAALSAPVGIRYPARRSLFAFLDAGTIVRVQRQFDRAEAAVRDDVERIERVRRARMSIDRATLLRRDALIGDRREWSWAGPRLDLSAVAARLRETWSARIDQRTPAPERPRARRAMERELRRWNGGRTTTSSEE